jgi:diguanylate cyclase (GGDEF)-like protein
VTTSLGAVRAPRKSRFLLLLDARQLGILAVAATFLLLIAVVIIGSTVIDRGSIGTQRSVALNSAYQHAASGVAAEESLERKYRLEPGPTPLAAHQAADRQVDESLARVARLGGSGDRRLATRVSAQHERYVHAAGVLFAAVNRRASEATVIAIDHVQVDPVFTAIQTAIFAAAATHEKNALAQVASSRRTGRIVLALDIATLLVGLGLIGVGAASLRRSQRGLRAQRDANLHLALHDDLTGLPNRALFQDRTGQALLAARRSGAQVAVMFVDLNRFKDVNDTLGHHYGDLLLVQVAERFSATLRGEDSVARLGGDEFAVLLGSSTRDEAVAAAHRLTEALQKPFNVRDIILDVEASIGIAIAAEHADVETVLRHADVAMYEAKSQHVPYAVYELTRDDNTVARLALLGDLRRGISRDELTLHYQPKVSAATGALHSVEALVRWNHPTRGLLPPDAFIPIAESTAVIHPLTEEVLRQALVQAKVWLEHGWAIPVAVNISARSLHDLNFPAQVQRQLDAVGLPSGLLSLELTESAIMIDPGRALTVLTALDAMGIALSIDDFGTGYSSMSYLKKLPVRELTIDRSFVMGLTTEANDVVLVQSAVDLGHNLGLHVVAEGVEDEATQHMLEAMGCDELQGYHISRPVTADLFNAWMERQHDRDPGHPAITEKV